MDIFKKKAAIGSPKQDSPWDEYFKPVNLEKELEEEQAFFGNGKGVGGNISEYRSIKAFKTKTDELIEALSERPTGRKTEPKETKSARRIKKESKKRNRK
jgi:hypothetical protein